MLGGLTAWPRPTVAPPRSNREAVAEQVIAMLGSIGLILAVPLTTALAACLATRLPAEELPAGAAHPH
jgi:hypothetical protein